MISAASPTLPFHPGMLILRNDASLAMGTGHAMRCLALAQAWQDAGGEVAAVMAQSTPALLERLKAENVSVICTNATPASAEDAVCTVEVARGRHASCVVVDGYHFDSHYQRLMKEAGLRLLVVDDIAKAGPYCADFVLNQNLHASVEMYSQCEPYTRLLLGTRYVMLRRDFRLWREREHPVSPVARRLLVAIGGSDPDNITEKVVEMLYCLQVPGWEAVVVLAKNSPHRAAVDARIRGGGLPIRLMEGVTEMAELMYWADLMVTAGGTTVWELACMGVPAVAMIRGEQERMLLQAAAQRGIAIDLGRFERVTPEAMGRALASLAHDEAGRLAMSRAGRALVDGLGATRVVEALGRVSCN